MTGAFEARDSVGSLGVPTVWSGREVLTGVMARAFMKAALLTGVRMIFLGAGPRTTWDWERTLDTVVPTSGGIDSQEANSGGFWPFSCSSSARLLLQICWRNVLKLLTKAAHGTQT
uniref:(northern house mosquito) hypothetical protein n=1 Tax=Culex pipiens TaxID=7175 RepID=A0A8D8A5D4_CULPI